MENSKNFEYKEADSDNFDKVDQLSDNTLAETKADLIVRVCRPPSGGNAGDHVEGEQRTVCRVDDGQGPHCVLVEEVSQERVIAEKTASLDLVDLVVGV